MSKILRYSALACSLFFYSCSVVTGNYHFTMGTQCLQKEEYEEAKNHLEQSVRDDSNFVGSQVNLAIAYIKLCETEKAWPHLRKAWLLDPQNKKCTELLNIYWNVYQPLTGIQKGAPKIEIINILGAPDACVAGKDEGTSCLVYGPIAIYFKDGKFDHGKFRSSCL